MAHANTPCGCHWYSVSRRFWEIFLWGLGLAEPKAV